MIVSKERFHFRSQPGAVLASLIEQFLALAARKSARRDEDGAHAQGSAGSSAA